MKFKKETTVYELIQKAPEKADILMSIGMECVGCPASLGETIEQACLVHGVDVDEVMEEINKGETDDKEKESKK